MSTLTPQERKFVSVYMDAALSLAQHILMEQDPDNPTYGTHLRNIKNMMTNFPFVFGRLPMQVRDSFMFVDGQTFNQKNEELHRLLDLIKHHDL